MLTLFVVGFAPPPLDLVVAPGVDSLHAALAQRRLTNSRATLRLQRGVHRLTRPLLLDARDADTAFLGAPGAVISGGIPVVGWTQVKPNLWEAPVPASLNLSDIGQRMQLFRGDERLTLARSDGLKYVHAEATNVTFANDDIRADFYDFHSVHLVMYESWTASFHRLASVDASTHTAQLASHYNAQWANQAAGSRYYVENCREYLDAPNEFYIDAPRRVVIVQLAANDTPTSGAPIVLAGPTALLRLGNTSRVSFSSIIFEHTAAESAGVLAGADSQSADHLTTAALHVGAGSSYVTANNCTFRHTGGYAFWADAGATNCNVTRCAAYDLGAGGVRLGAGHKATAMSTDHVVSDSTLADGGHVWQQGAGVLAQNIARVKISHNHIHHFRYTGVSTGWTWGYGATNVSDVLVEFNHIHDIGMGYLSDMGCLYTLGHQPRSAVMNNWCHDVQSYNYGGWGFYTDEGSRGINFENNVASRTKCAGHHQHYGTDNVLSNNIYYDVDIGDVPTPGRPEVLMAGHCDAAIRASTHGRNLAKCADPTTSPDDPDCCCHPGCDQGKCSSFLFERNIVYAPKGANTSFVGTTWAGGLTNFSFNSNVYFFDGAPPGQKLFNFTDAQKFNENFTEWQNHGKDAHSLVADPKFVSGAPTFALDPASPAVVAEGFVPIDLSSVGPRPHK